MWDVWGMWVACIFCDVYVWCLHVRCVGCAVFLCVQSACACVCVHALDMASSASPKAWGRNSLTLFTGLRPGTCGGVLGSRRGLRRASKAKCRGRGQGFVTAISGHNRG